MFGISLVLTCLIFPQSLNNLCMDLLTNKALKRIRGIIHLQEELLHTSPNDPKFKELVEKVKQLRQGFIETISALEGNGSMLQLEVSYGKTSPGQVAALIKEVKELGERTFALGSLTVSDTAVVSSADTSENDPRGPPPLPGMEGPRSASTDERPRTQD